MESIKKFVVAAFILASSSIAYAHTMGSEIVLNGGQAAYDQTINISLDKLLKNIKYDVICILNSDHKSKEVFDDIQITTSNFNVATFSVNGQPLDASGQTNIPNVGNSELVASNVYKEAGSILVRNIDDTDTVTVSICYADPHRS